MVVKGPYEAIYRSCAKSTFRCFLILRMYTFVGVLVLKFRLPASQNLESFLFDETWVGKWSFQAEIRIRHLVDKNIWEMPLSKGLNLGIWFSYFCQTWSLAQSDSEKIWGSRLWEKHTWNISRVYWRSCSQEAVLHTVAGRNRSRGLDWREHRGHRFKETKEKTLGILWRF